MEIVNYLDILVEKVVAPKEAYVNLYFTKVNLGKTFRNHFL